MESRREKIEAIMSDYRKAHRAESSFLDGLYAAISELEDKAENSNSVLQKNRESTEEKIRRFLSEYVIVSSITNVLQQDSPAFKVGDIVRIEGISFLPDPDSDILITIRAQNFGIQWQGELPFEDVDSIPKDRALQLIKLRKIAQHERQIRKLRGETE